MKWKPLRKANLSRTVTLGISFLCGTYAVSAHAGSSAEWTWTPSKAPLAQMQSLSATVAKPTGHRKSGALTRAVVIALADKCASTTPAATLASLAEVESGFDPLTIHDNTTGENHHPASSFEAVDLTEQLLRRRHDLDIGLMQINIRNLSRLQLSMPQAFTACQSLRAAGQLLNANYELALNARVGSSLLQTAYSIYNTGRAGAGFRNGYTDKVVDATKRAR